MSFWVSGAVMIGALATSAATVYSAKKTAAATKKAAEMQEKSSQDALRQQTQEMNKANQREADQESILEGNTTGDTQSTMLTGPGGAGLTLDDLILGRGTSMLGGRQ